MHLNIANVAHFLICRGLLSPDAILAGDLVVLDASRRNRNFKVIRDALDRSCLNLDTTSHP